MASHNKGLLLVMADIDPEDEDEFNRWYNQEHLPGRLSVPGFVSGRRYRAIDGSPKYLALYELESSEVLNSKEYRAVSKENETQWSKRMFKKWKNTVRNVYVEIDLDEKSES
jgi:hypothetical protein